MARPEKDDSERRTYHLGVRLTPAERGQLEKAAAAAGVALGEYVRRQALGRGLVIHPPRSLAPAAFKQLRQLGITINQVTRTANGKQRLPRTLGRLAKRVTRFVDDHIGYGEGLDAAAVDQLRRIAVNAAQLARLAHDHDLPVPVALAGLRKRLDRLLTEAGAYGS